MKIIGTHDKHVGLCVRSLSELFEQQIARVDEIPRGELATRQALFHLIFVVLYILYSQIHSYIYRYLAKYIFMGVSNILLVDHHGKLNILPEHHRRNRRG